MLFHYKVGVIPGAVVGTVPRQKNPVNGYKLGCNGDTPKVVFVLKHSGRIVRKIQAGKEVLSVSLFRLII